MSPPFPSAPDELGFEGEVVVGFTPPAPDAAPDAWRESAVAACQANLDHLSQFRGYRVEVALVVPIPDSEEHDYAPVTSAVLAGIVSSQAVVPCGEPPWLTVERPWMGVMVRPEVRMRFRCAAPLSVTMPF